MPVINIKVRDKIAYREEDSLPFIVSGNSDYAVVFDFDGEWDEYVTKTARFIMGGGYTDVVFDGCECAIPTLRGGGVLEVGVYAGDIHTTTSAEIGVKPCVTSGGEENAPPTPDVYAQIMEKLNSLGGGGGSVDVEALKTAIEEALSEAKASGEFDGENGEDGEDGNGIASAVLNSDYTLTLTFTDKTSYTTPSIRGARGAMGEAGTSITVTSKTRSDGATIITFSDGTIVPIPDGLQGAPGINGRDGRDGKDYVLTDADKEEIAAQAASLVGEIPDYWQSELDAKAVDIRKAMSVAGRNKSAFLWYSDTHWTESNKRSPMLLNYLCKNTPINNVNFGGDIVQAEPNNDAIDDVVEMEYLNEWRSAIRGLKHHSVVGNHDDCEGQNNLFTPEFIYSFLLAPEEDNDMVMGDGLYYYIDNKVEKTRYLYLDTAYQGATASQLEFVVNALDTTPESWHVVAIAHIWLDASWTEEKGDYIAGYSSHASKFLQLFYAYNHKNSGSVSDVAFDFANATGRFEFCIGGHAHWDYTSYYNDEILVILTATDSTRVRVDGITATVGTTDENSVNAIVADYNNSQVSVIRVGRGESRVEELKAPVIISYTNVLPTAINKDGSIFDEDGYAKDMRYKNSSSAFVSNTGTYCTGFIKVTPGVDSVIRLKNVRMNPDGDSINACHLLYFDGSFTSLGTSNSTVLLPYHDAVQNEDGDIVQFTINAEHNASYFILNTSYIGADSIITINEPIE
jgi:hypothetical protein